MRNPLLLAALLSAFQLFTGCQTDAEVRPASYDALALATGHWEWESTAYQGGARTPATMGFTRQLVFGEGSQLTVRRSGQAEYHTSYQLSMGSLKSCGLSASVPFVSFASESDLPNNANKAYRLSQQSSQLLLYLTGEAACADAGAYETYHWVAE